MVNLAEAAPLKYSNDQSLWVSLGGGTTITMSTGDPKGLYPRLALTSKAVPN